MRKTKSKKKKQQPQVQQEGSSAEPIVSSSSDSDNELITQSVSCLSGFNPVDCLQQTEICIFGAAADVAKAFYSGFNVIVDDDTIASKEKMVQFEQSLCQLFPYVIECSFFYHSRVGELFPSVLSGLLKLQKITIVGSSLIDQINNKWWTAIWKHSSVNHLTWINMMGKIPNTNFNIPYGHLREMIFYNYAGDLVPIIKKCSANLELLKLDSIQQYECDLDVLKRVFDDNDDIGNNASKLKLESTAGISIKGGTQANFLELIVKQFKNLKVLEIRAIQKLSLADVVLHLSNLTNLTDLTVNCQIGPLDFASTRRLPPLLTVTNLNFHRTFPFSYSVELFKSTFSRLFPNLNKLKLEGECRHFIETIEQDALVIFPRLIEYHLELLNAVEGKPLHYMWELEDQARTQ